NRLINKLIMEGFLTSDLSISSAGKRLFEEHRVNNAIILAAGYGMRMTPINNDVPKALLQVKGEVLIERIIQQLHDKQIYDINIV
ncbi:NTP transferase domain-containing protein, partial [Lactobacillus salivarius]|nr:NTP transferase domain-containing protein [Ligilactobacillus salivarius]